jgi:hypothetical protein
MFEALLVVAVLITLIGMLAAMDGSHDVFHPLVFIGPMMIFLYGWIPWKIYSIGGLEQFFDEQQLVFVQTINVLGILAFVGACLASGLRLRCGSDERSPELSQTACRRLLIGAAVAGSLGLLCWVIMIVNVGGFVNAYSTSYTGGWDDSGYVRDGTLLLLVGILLSITSLSLRGPRLPSFLMLGVFGLPWLSQALLTARRGPTFAVVVITLMGWYMNREKRPPVLSVCLGGLFLGWIVLFLVTNRSSIYLGSRLEVTTDVGGIVDKPDTGNEFIYGSGTILNAQRRDHYFWMRRYLAQILVRPIPSAIWPTKYEDFGVPELLQNAGTGEGFSDSLGWVGAVGSAPGIIADLWVEVWWLCVPLMALLGWGYGFVWKRAVTRRGPWASQYVILSALSIYLVMQTMEAVIFRSLLLSIPCWLIWRWALQPVPIRQLRQLPESVRSWETRETIDHA